MQTFLGKSVWKGIAIGKIYVYASPSVEISGKKITDVSAEIERFHQAREDSILQLSQLYQTALKEVGKEEALIFDVHRMILEDANFLKKVEAYITEEKVTAEYAVQMSASGFSELLNPGQDEYMAARLADIQDLAVRLIRNLRGIGESSLNSTEPVILLANDLSPSETIRMDKNKILGIVTKNGSVHSHTAILARNRNIPTLVKTNVELLQEYHGKMAVVDGISGALILEPSPEVLKQKTAERKKWLESLHALVSLKGMENITSDGRHIQVYANIENAEDLEQVLLNDAGGIGLFRSEFLYLGRSDYPSEEEQFESYKRVLSGMEGKKVVIRTMDIGVDKKADYLKFPKEENPAMGFRAIRICLERTEVFKTQLRAIYRASAFGNAAIMFPMITSLWEVLEIKKIVEEVKAELREKGQAYGEVELGIMLETPAAVMISDELAEEVDFFSIGTNDLTQYTLAVDRQNPNLDRFFDAHHKAVLKLIRLAVENGHKKGILVGICGELAADTTLTETFLNMGVDELSVSPSQVLQLRKVIREL